MNDAALLDHPVWHALATAQRPLALRAGRAARYPAAMSPFAATAEPSPAAFDDLRALVEPGAAVALETPDELAPPPGWNGAGAIPVDQLVWSGALSAAAGRTEPSPLGPGDVPAMLELTRLTKPGPFLPDTLRMGRYFGLRGDDGRLLAMAGERMRLSGFTEISAVCTHPEFRGRGFAATLLDRLVRLLLSEGTTPFLHVVPDNPARRLYVKQGFRHRRSLVVTRLSPA